MALSVRSFNRFMFFKLPAAWWCGVRLTALDGNRGEAAVTHRWINQNPFRSMFWAVQGMAAELSTGALVMYHIRKSGLPISMLVLNNRANFSKKATGRIRFECPDGDKVRHAIDQAVTTGKGQTVWMQSVGVNADGVTVSTFDFEWTLKVKS
ncbi:MULTISPECIES: DUF4442 domain-containing protein [unclassified Robiginitalea]|uniref:DUF4442 domain-containing protein n=1 Tax=Robiginitalea TaxID=252306 RepID=UPI00234A802D|nr:MULTISPECIES: DUF4442 domain-containing protein [unclassified Robiginitalea]MDC6354960.1 DUF4442 domain-containing protein [Robiginitalea sp. PM2]MDC6375226.1 DUF4442 domain-containing protein [Robiginitalea sp. SP8]